MKKNKPKNEIEKVVDIITQRMADQIDKEVMRSIYLNSKCTNAVMVNSDSQTLTMEKLIKVCNDIRKQYPDELRTKLKKWEFPFLYENWNIKP